MNSFYNVIKKAFDNYKSIKSNEKNYKIKYSKYVDRIRSIEDKLEREFYKKYPTKELRDKAWKELEDALKDRNYKELSSFLKSNRDSINLLGDVGLGVGGLAGLGIFKFLSERGDLDSLTNIITDMIKNAFEFQSEGAIILLTCIILGGTSSILVTLSTIIGGLIGRESVYVIGSLSKALVEEIKSKRKSKNENLMDSLDYHFYKLIEAKIDDEELQKKRDRITKDRHNFDTGWKIMTFLGSIPLFKMVIEIALDRNKENFVRDLAFLMDKYPEYAKDCISEFNTKNTLKISASVDSIVGSMDSKAKNFKIPPKEFMQKAMNNAKMIDKLVILQYYLSKIPYFGNRIQLLDYREKFPIYRNKYGGRIVNPREEAIKVSEMTKVVGVHLERLYNKKLPFTFLIGALIFLLGAKAVESIYNKLKEFDKNKRKEANEQ